MQFLERVFVTDIGYTIQISELIYYWIISIGLLYLAYKTYVNTFKKEVALITQLSYYEGFYDENLYLEIYNNGNDVAKNIVLNCYNNNLIDPNNSIFNNDLGFIKPNSYIKIHVGYSSMGNISFFGKKIAKEEFLNQEIKLNIKYNKFESKDFILNTSFLSSLSSVYTNNNPLRDTSKSLKEISKTLKNIDNNISEL